MLDPFRKKSRVLSRLLGRGGPNPVPGLGFQIGKPRSRPGPARRPLNMAWERLGSAGSISRNPLNFKSSGAFMSFAVCKSRTPATYARYLR